MNVVCSSRIDKDMNCILNDLLFNLWCTMNEIVIPKLVTWIFDDLNECDEQTPRMRAIHNQTFKQHTCYLLLHRKKFKLK